MEVYYMAVAKKIRTVLIERDMSIKELAEKIGTTGNNLSNKLSRDNFSEKELCEIAEALNCDYDGIFTLRESGKKI
jgi:DNA-binding Xre family transcriptional regulator